MAKQDISKEQFIKICTDYGFEVKELYEPWRTNGTLFVAYISHYGEPIACHIQEENETNVCVKLDCLYDGHVYFKMKQTCQPADVQKFKFFLGEINKTVKNHILNMKISKMQEEDF